MDALTFVRERLKTSPHNLREIADGAGIGHSWLRMFARGEIPDPGYSKIKALSDYFMRETRDDKAAGNGANAAPVQDAAA